MTALVLGWMIATTLGPLVPALHLPRVPLRYAPAPVDNPLKGLVPYADAAHDRFPHSLEFDYLPLSALVVGPDRYDWRPMEKLLDAIAGRGRQAVVRIYLEYPGRRGGIPQFLVRDGLTVHRYTNTALDPPQRMETPDYADPRLRKVLVNFVREFGRRYDGDPRLGFITAGLLGAWGEWHTWPRDELFANKDVQTEILDAYQAAFRTTPVLLRRPAGPNDPHYAANAHRPFGYHDDSFAWATLETGRPEDDWFFQALLRKVGPAALDKWKTHPIGGEIRPEAWGRVFDPDPGDRRIQNFRRCVEATHVSWLLDTGLFREPAPAARRQRAEEEVRRMGYEFHARSAGLGWGDDGRLLVAVEIENRGVAPFYATWTPEYALLDDAGQLVPLGTGHGRLTGLLPGDPPRLWVETFASPVPRPRPGDYRVLLRVPNPLPAGRPLRFANAEQDRDRPGWLTLGRITVR